MIIFKHDKLKNICLVALQESAKKHNINLEEIDIEPDHVHMIVKLPLTMSVSKALQLLKGTSSRIIFGLCPNLRLRYPKGHLWSKGKFAGSIGHITLEVAKEYVKNQEAHHAITLNRNLHPLGWGGGQFCSDNCRVLQFFIYVWNYFTFSFL